ncbi:MAG TPA: alanine racemase [Micromonosporaceae bacterium]|nr:alanine racemase [Micromonosporaceae bacterium]
MLDDQLDWRVKGFWQPDAPIGSADFARARHNLFGGAFTWPVMVARRTALESNLEAMAAFCARHELDFAPHGKTTMAPTLFAAQLRAGAWALTVATAAQVVACRAFGVPRVLLANQLLDGTVIRWIANQDFEFFCFVDSVAGVEAINTALAAAPPENHLKVLVELGFPGGRAGCRTIAELTEVAQAASQSPRVRLAGVAGYEGGLPGVVEAGQYLDSLRAATIELAPLLPDQAIVSAGGSAYFDLVADRLRGQWLPGHRLRAVLRSGAYVSHDHGFYQEKTPFIRVPEEGSLAAALEIWAQVTSTPEEGLVIAGLGKRDAPHDEGLPVPLLVRGSDGVHRDASSCRVVRLNDHHAFVEAPPGTRIKVGDLMGFGISHPCTAFDKWRVIPVVEDDYTVSDVLHTYF